MKSAHYPIIAYFFTRKRLTQEKLKELTGFSAGMVSEGLNYMLQEGYINLDKVSEFTVLKSTNTTISTATTKPASNITLTESMDNYDSLLIPIQLGNGGINYIEISLADNGDKITLPYANSWLSSTELQQFMFTIERDSATTLTAYYGGYVKLTMGATNPSWNALGHTIYPIYGIKR